MSTLKISTVKGTGIVVRGNDTDTDRIIPARYLKEITFVRMGEYAFYDERYDQEGNEKEHPFNAPEFQHASILIVNDNFGCGSSREHAPQALLRWGIKAIIGESLADIFSGNCGMLGIPIVLLPQEEIERLMTFVENNPDAAIEVDLERQEAHYDDHALPVQMNESMRESLLNGTWDTTSLMLEATERVSEIVTTLPYVNRFETA